MFEKRPLHSDAAVFIFFEKIYGGHIDNMKKYRYNNIEKE